MRFEEPIIPALALCLSGLLKIDVPYSLIHPALVIGGLVGALAIIGASRPEQIEENAAASGIVLDEETLRRIDEILAVIEQRFGRRS